MATRIKHGRSSMSLLLINSAGQSGKELSLNGDVSITNSTALSNAFNDHFSTIAWEITLINGPSFQEFKYLWPLKWKIPNSSPLIVIRCCLLEKGCLENDDLENEDLRPRKRWPRKRRPRKRRPRKRRPRKRHLENDDLENNDLENNDLKDDDLENDDLKKNRGEGGRGGLIEVCEMPHPGTKPK